MSIIMQFRLAPKSPSPTPKVKYQDIRPFKEKLQNESNVNSGIFERDIFSRVWIGTPTILKSIRNINKVKLNIYIYIKKKLLLKNISEW